MGAMKRLMMDAEDHARKALSVLDKGYVGDDEFGKQNVQAKLEKLMLDLYIYCKFSDECEKGLDFDAAVDKAKAFLKD